MNRSKRRRPTVNLDEIDPPVSNFKRPDQWIDYDEDFRRLKGAMNQLPYEQKEAVIMHIQGKMKFREIAKSQKASIKTVLSRYRYGLSKLRSILKSEVEK